MNAEDRHADDSAGANDTDTDSTVCKRITARDRYHVNKTTYTLDWTLCQDMIITLIIEDQLLFALSLSVFIASRNIHIIRIGLFPA